MSRRKAAWEIAWKPVLMVLAYAVVCIRLAWKWFQRVLMLLSYP